MRGINIDRNWCLTPITPNYPFLQLVLTPSLF